MNIVFTELFDAESKILCLVHEDTIFVINNYAKKEEINYDDLALCLFMKKEENKNSHLIILTQCVGKELHLLLPFRIQNELFPNIEILEPLLVLELLAQYCGLVLKIGSHIGRFMFKEEWFTGEQPTKLVEVINPENHSFLQNVFVKINKFDDKFKVKCAIAFCLDRTRYLGAIIPQTAEYPFKEKSLENDSKKLVSLETIHQIQKNAMKESDKKKAFNLLELGLSLQIIRKIMGDNWYKKVLKQFKPKEKISDREYHKLVKNDNVHPLSECLWSGKAQDYIRVLSFAHFLYELWDQTDSNNLSEKVKELQQYSFGHAYYELKIASYFHKRMQVTFIKRENGLKTPDLRIDSVDGFAFAECKLKDSSNIQIGDFFEEASIQIERYGGPGIIFIELIVPFEEIMKELTEEAAFLLENAKKVSLLILTSERLREEFDTISLSTNVRGFPNGNSDFALPKSIKEAAYFQNPITWTPFSQLLC